MRMKFVFAPDSFKGSLTAMEICARLSRVAARHFPAATLQSLPMADGGEGTVDALVLAGGGHKEELCVTGPMGVRVQAQYGVLRGGESVVLEMAQASGLPLVPVQERNPLQASSIGTGEMLAQVMAQGYREILIGLGGSATNDGGMGMLSALGVRFTDKAGTALSGCGADLARVDAVDMSGLHPLLAQTKITVMCDVTNPLLGEQGATAVYGAQKGAGADMRALLEQGMANYAQVMEKALGKDISSFAGAGAAGGMGAALAGILGAQLQPGIEAVLDAVDFDKQIAQASLVITGEGRMDGQSVRYGKVPAGVAKRCAKQDVPVIAIVGGMDAGAEEFYDLAQGSIMTTVNGIMTLGTAMDEAKALFDDAADRVFRMIKIGMRL